MEPSRFEAPTSVEDAVALLQAEIQADRNARVLAGGTDLLVQLRIAAGAASWDGSNGGAAPEAPSTFVDIKRIPRLMSMQIDQGRLVMGAAVPAVEIFESDVIRANWPGLAEATDLIGSTQIQGRATWCGNLCNASPAADAVPALIACQAEAVIAGPSGERHVAVADFTIGPGKTVLRPGEFVVEFLIPAPAPRTADAYLRMTPRTEMDIAVAAAAVSLTLDAESRIEQARVVLGAVAPTAIRVAESEAALVGTRLEESALAALAATASAAAHPIDDRRGTAAYRKTVVGVLAKRAAQTAYQRASA